jgi:hypothetical protein
VGKPALLRCFLILLVALAGVRIARAGEFDTNWAAASAEARIAARFANRNIPYPPRAVTLIALKSEARMELWAEADNGWTFVRSYLVQTTSGRLGPKLREGDHQVPEGVYRVSALNPRSMYHLALRLDYPNAFDQQHGREDGRGRLGGDIMIHGDRVSDGCLPMGDDATEELFVLARQVGVENVAVIVSPMDLRRVPVSTASRRAVTRPPWLGELYADIALTLQAFPLPSSDSGLPRQQKASFAPQGVARCERYDAAECVRQCELGDLRSCARAGVLYSGGRGVTTDARKAWTLLSRACDGGDALGCGALSGLVIQDDGLRRDVAHAASLARTACDGGDGHGCVTLAQLCNDKLFYSDNPDECSKENVLRLRQRAVNTLVSSCRGWAAYDCYTLATIYAPGDQATAVRSAKGSCAAGDPSGCELLASLNKRAG